MLFKKIIFVYSENHMRPINTIRKENTQLLNVKIAGAYNYKFNFNR